MKIRVIFNFLLISFMFFFSFYSFSQTKPTIQIFDSAKVCDGYILWQDLVSSGHLMERHGETLYNFPGNLCAFFNYKNKIASRIDYNKLVVYNKDFNKLWEVKMKTFISHEITITPDDNILLISVERLPLNHLSLQYDIVLCFDSTGKELFKWSTFDQRKYLLSFMMTDTNIFRYKLKGSHDPDSVLYQIAPSLKIMEGNTSPEFFHMNAIQIIPENESEKKDTIFKKGNILLSFCNYSDSLASFIAIVDPINYKILWHYVQKDRRPMHTPTMLSNGHILVYVNTFGFSQTDSSSIDEIDPLTNKIVWSYTEKFSNSNIRVGRGSCQRLPNGNTLISNCNGYIYEVTPDKKIVWSLLVCDSPGQMYRAYLYPREKLNWLVNEE